MSLRSFVRYAAVAIVAVAATLIGASSRAQQAAERPSVLNAEASRFVVAPTAAADLRRLWTTSIAAREERVACLGGERPDSITYITQVLVLEPGSAD